MAAALIASSWPASATGAVQDPRSSGSVQIVASVAAQVRLVGPPQDPCVAINTATAGYRVIGGPAGAIASCAAGTALPVPSTGDVLIIAPD